MISVGAGDSGARIEREGAAAGNLVGR